MDPELRAYLEEQRTATQELTAAVQELRSSFQDQQSSIQELRSSFQDQQSSIQELRAYVEERFEQVDSRFGKVEESDRHTRILVEGLRGEVQLVAETVVGLQKNREADRAEIMREIGDVKSLLITSYSNLDRRVTELESWRKRRDRVQSP